MPRKHGRLFRVDQSISDEFTNVCDKQGVNYSTVIEDFMKNFITADGHLVADELFAPMISHAVKNAVSDGVDRIAKILYPIRKDVTATLVSVPQMYKKNTMTIEALLSEHLVDQVFKEALPGERKSVVRDFKINEQGAAMIEALRKHADTDMKKVNKEIKNNG